MEKNSKFNSPKVVEEEVDLTEEMEIETEEEEGLIEIDLQEEILVIKEAQELASTAIRKDISPDNALNVMKNFTQPEDQEISIEEIEEIETEVDIEVTETEMIDMKDPEEMMKEEESTAVTPAEAMKSVEKDIDHLAPTQAEAEVDDELDMGFRTLCSNKLYTYAFKP